MNIKEIIYNIRKRPKMYLLDFRLDYEYHYLAGILTCYRTLVEYSEKDINYIFNDNFYTWVFEWVQKHGRRSCDFSFVWYEMIMAVSLNENEAIDLFYTICDDFFAHYNDEYLSETL